MVKDTPLTVSTISSPVSVGENPLVISPNNKESDGIKSPCPKDNIAAIVMRILSPLEAKKNKSEKDPALTSFFYFLFKGSFSELSI